MDYRVDEKGKYYTVHVNKSAVPMVAGTLTNIIRGTCHIMPDNRLHDQLNSSEHFIAVTQAEVFDLSGNVLLYRNEVVLLNRDHIVWMLPSDKNKPACEEITSDPERPLGP